jgi:hypothetical protein
MNGGSCVSTASQQAGWLSSPAVSPSGGTCGMQKNIVGLVQEKIGAYGVQKSWWMWWRERFVFSLADIL